MTETKRGKLANFIARHQEGLKQSMIPGKENFFKATRHNALLDIGIGILALREIPKQDLLVVPAFFSMGLFHLARAPLALIKTANDFRLQRSKA